MRSSTVDFVVIGAMKCGTTTLYETLRQHPEISLTKQKEANFFNHPITPERSRWYEQQFATDSGLRGDVSPNYAKRHLSPATAESLANYAPGAKIIYLVRDPLRRIISHLHHDRLRARVGARTDLGEVTRKNNDYLQTSAYHHQLSAFTEFFPSEQVLVLSFEELIKDFAPTMAKIAGFLGLSAGFSWLLAPANLTEKRYQIPFHDKVHRYLSNRRLKKLYHWFWYFVNIQVPKPQPSEEELRQWKTTLAPDTEAFVKTYPGIDQYWTSYKTY